MSKTVDERVVSMQFDNKNFEQNVSTTMSTLDKLKAKLNLSRSAKGLEDIGTAARKVDLNPLSNSAEKVGLKFNAMYTIADQAFRNMYNSAEQYAKRIVSAFTIDPIKTGFQEYETQINAVQTILANTSSKGTTLDQVNEALDTLNTYADKTIYNFTEMTRNIGTFTAAGVDLNTSVNAIQGIANLAAVSGSTSQQASTAMYQLSQALASGTVKLMDWNSVVNAGMGGEVFQNALKETSAALNTGAEAAIKAKGSFRESLSAGWLTSEVLTETLKKFTTTGANEYVAKYTGLSEEAIQSALDSAKAQYGEADAIDKAAEALAEKSGKSKEEIKNTLQFAKTAEDAATKVKTFTQLMDTLKEAAQSGWTQTWELIFGDFEEAKELFSGLSDFLGGFINKISKARNDIVAGVMGSPLGKFAESLKNITGATEEMTNAFKKFKDPLEVVDSVIRGEWGNTQKRWDALTEAGYDWVEVQNLVNEKLGSSVRRTSQYSDAQKQAAKSNKYSIEQLLKLTEAELRDLDLKDDQIEALKMLAEMSEKTGIPIEELAKDLDLLSGRSLLINSFKNAGKALLDTFKAIGQAWKEIFPPKSEEEKVAAIYNVIAAIHKYTTKIKDAIYENGELTEKGKNLVRTLKGLFAIIDIIVTITGGAFRIAFKILTKVLGAFNIDILEFTAIIGDAIVAVRDWFDSLLDVNKLVEKFGPIFKNAWNSIKAWFKGMKDAENLPEYIVDGMINGFKGAIKLVGDIAGVIGRTILNKIKSVLGIESDAEFFNSGTNIVQGLANGLWNGVKLVGQVIAELAGRVISKFKEILGIHSPSVVFMAIGGFIISGLIIGLQNGSLELTGVVNGLGDFIISMLTKVVDFIKELDLGKVLIAGLGVGFIAVGLKIVTAISNITAAFEGLGDMFEGIGGWFKARAWNQKGTVILKIAIAIGILAASLALLASLESRKLWEAFGALSALVGLLGILSAVAIGIEKAGTIDKTKAKGVDTTALTLVGVAASLLLIAIAMQKLAGIDEDKIDQALGLFAGIIVALVILTKTIGKSFNAKTMADVDKLGVMMGKMAVAMLIMVAVIKLASLLDGNTVIRGMAVIGLIELLFLATIAVSKVAGKNGDKAGKLLTKMSVAMLIMLAVIKIAGSMDSADVARGLMVVGAIELMFLAIIAVSKIAGRNADKAGKMIFKMSLALIIIAGAVSIAAKLDASEVKRAMGVIAIIGGVFTALIAVSNIAGKHADKAGKMLLKMSFALLVLTLVITLLTFLDPTEMWNAVAAVSVLEIIFGGLIAVTKIAKGTAGMTKTLTLLLAAVVVLAGVVVGLSFLDPEGAWNGVGAISALIGVFSLLMVATKYTKNTKGMHKSLLTMLGVVVILAGIVTGLSFIDAGNAIKSCTAIAILLAALSVSLVILGKTGRISTTVNKTLPAMLGVVAGLAVILGLMSAFNVEASIPSAIALSVLVNAMAIALVILSKTSKSTGNALKGVLALTAMAVPLIAFVGVLAVMQNVQNAISNVMALVLLTTAMTLLLIPLTLIGTFVAQALLGVLALTSMAVPLLAFVGVLYLMQNIQNATENVKLLTDLLTTMTAVLTVLAIIGPFALIGVAALTALTVLVGAIGVFATAVGALITAFPQLEEFLDKGIPIMEKICYGIGSMVGNLISGFATGVMSGLPEIGRLLSEFWYEVQPFVEGVKTVDEKVLAGVGILAASILALVIVDLINGIKEFLTFGSSFVDLGTDLTDFWYEVKPFIEGVKSIGAETIESVKSLAEAILIITAADLLNNITNFLGGGESSLSQFGSELGGLGEGIVSFYSGIKDLDDSALEKTKLAAEVIKVMAEAAGEIPAEGGWVQKICGEQSLAAFGTELASLGQSLTGFAFSVSDLTEDDKNRAVMAAEMVQEFASVASEIPATDGWLQKIIGENSLAAFGTDLQLLGSNLMNFAAEIYDLTEDDKSRAILAAEMVQEFADVAKDVPSVDTWIDKLFGESSLSAFGADLVKLGSSLTAFAGEISGLTEEDITKTTYAVQMVAAMAEVAKSLPEESGFSKLLSWFSNDDDGALAKFGEDMSDLGSSLGDFMYYTEDLDPEKMKSAIDAIKSVVNVAKTLDETGLSGEDETDFLKEFGRNLVALGEDIGTFGSNVGNIDPEFVTTAARLLSTMSNSLSSLSSAGLLEDTDRISAFGNDLAIFGTKLVSFYNSTKDIDGEKISSTCTSISRISGSMTKIAEINSKMLALSATAIDKLVDVINSASNITAESTSGFVDAVNNLANANVDGLIATFEAANDEFKSSGSDLMDNFILGMKSKFTDIKTSGTTAVDNLTDGAEASSEDAKSAFEGIVAGCVEAIRLTYTSFHGAGAYVGAGFANGVSSTLKSASSAGASLGRAALNAAKRELNEHSPSKEFYSIGEYAGLGFVNALYDYTSEAYKSGAEVASFAKSGLTETASRIAEAIDSDIDFQPTICPVMDLSNIHSGANEIGSMFSGRHTLAVDTQAVGLISASMAEIQNGRNSDDIVAAIKSLRGDLNKMPRNSYHFGNVTYDDGSAVGNAVADLTRALRIERRK